MTVDRAYLSTGVREDIERLLRWSAIIRALGCERYGCRLDTSEDLREMDTVVRHNEDVRAVAWSTRARATDGMRPVFVAGDLAPVAWVPYDIWDWIDAAHVVIDARREAERQAALATDPWLEHAAMTTLRAD